jgi:hypothetical protein
MHKHIPTLTLVHYKDQGYAYRYDDQWGNTQEEGTFPNLKDAIGSAALHLKTFTLLEEIETQD